MIDATLRDALLSFVRDVTGNDAELIETVRGFTENPPTTLEEIGFYGVENASADERAFRATVSALGQDGTMLLFEDKYIDEMPYLLGEQGWISETAAAEADVFLSDVGEAHVTMDRPEVTKLAADRFADHVAVLERAISAMPHRVLYIDVPVGDTFHLLRVSPAVFEKWSNTLFLRTETSRFAVTAPQWDVYWVFLTSALGLDWQHPNPAAALDESQLHSLRARGF